MATNLIRFEAYENQDRSDGIHDVPLSSVLRDLAENGDILVLGAVGDVWINPGPPDMELGTAYGVGDWDESTYVINGTSGASWMPWIRLTAKENLPATVTATMGGPRGAIWGIWLLRGVDVTKIESWTSAVASDPSFAENTDLNTGAGLTHDESYVISITGDQGTFPSDTVPLTLGPWTQDHQGYFHDGVLAVWAVMGHLVVAEAGQLARQDLHTTNISDACSTIAFPAFVAAPETTSEIDLTGTDHLTEFKLNPQIKNRGQYGGHRSYRSMFSKFDGLNRGKLVRAVYDAGWTVTPYPGTDSMTVDETVEAEFVWRGGQITGFSDRFGGLVTALTNEGYTASET